MSEILFTLYIVQSIAEADFWSFCSLFRLKAWSIVIFCLCETCWYEHTCKTWRNGPVTLYMKIIVAKNCLKWCAKMQIRYFFNSLLYWKFQVQVCVELEIFLMYLSYALGTNQVLFCLKYFQIILKRIHFNKTFPLGLSQW